jgi:hypothetical protein
MWAVFVSETLVHQAEYLLYLQIPSFTVLIYGTFLESVTRPYLNEDRRW